MKPRLSSRATSKKHSRKRDASSRSLMGSALTDQSVFKPRYRPERDDGERLLRGTVLRRQPRNGPAILVSRATGDATWLLR
jgi:hypothetical protein